MNRNGTTPRIGYTGNEKNIESRYINMGARQYDPALGRFMSPDPLFELSPGKTPYHYCHNSPLIFKDPSGLTEMMEEIQIIILDEIDGLKIKNNCGCKHGRDCPLEPGDDSGENDNNGTVGGMGGGGSSVTVSYYSTLDNEGIEDGFSSGHNPDERPSSTNSGSYSSGGSGSLKYDGDVKPAKANPVNVGMYNCVQARDRNQNHGQELSESDFTLYRGEVELPVLAIRQKIYEILRQGETDRDHIEFGGMVLSLNGADIPWIAIEADPGQSNEARNLRDGQSFESINLLKRTNANATHDNLTLFNRYSPFMTVIMIEFHFHPFVCNGQVCTEPYPSPPDMGLASDNFLSIVFGIETRTVYIYNSTLMLKMPANDFFNLSNDEIQRIYHP